MEGGAVAVQAIKWNVSGGWQTDERKDPYAAQQMGQQKLSIMQHNILSNSTRFDFDRVQWSSAKFCWQRFQFGTGTSGIASHASHPCWMCTVYDIYIYKYINIRKIKGQRSKYRHNFYWSIGDYCIGFRNSHQSRAHVVTVFPPGSQWWWWWTSFDRRRHWAVRVVAATPVPFARQSFLHPRPQYDTWTSMNILVWN